MGTIVLTRESVSADISAYQDRLHSAQQALRDLPTWGQTYKERKRLSTDRNRLMAEMEHVRRLIGYAQQALEELGGDNHDRQL